MDIILAAMVFQEVFQEDNVYVSRFTHRRR